MLAESAAVRNVSDDAPYMSGQEGSQRRDMRGRDKGCHDTRHRRVVYLSSIHHHLFTESLGKVEQINW